MRISPRRVILLILVLAALAVAYRQQQDNTPTVVAKAAVLMDAASGKLLYSLNSEEPLPPASMSKMMTEYIVLENIQNGSIKWTDRVSMTNSQMDSEAAKLFVHKGDSLTVKDLFLAMVISSANNAAVSLAEKIAGSEPAFTVLMNQKAMELGLSEATHFVNATGLENAEDPGQTTVMTAHDVAQLAYRLVNDFPEVLETTRLPSYRLNYGGIHLTSTNLMLGADNPDVQFEGVDGLKTGFTDQAGYCFAGTAKQGNKRLISVVMGASDETSRFIETKKLFSYGFGKTYLPSFLTSIRQFFNTYVRHVNV